MKACHNHKRREHQRRKARQLAKQGMGEYLTPFHLRKQTPKLFFPALPPIEDRYETFTDEKGHTGIRTTIFWEMYRQQYHAFAVPLSEKLRPVVYTKDIPKEFRSRTKRYRSKIVADLREIKANGAGHLLTAHHD
jgi:hypothetical protein